MGTEQTGAAAADPVVTQREYRFAAEATLMSTTDLHSHIQYANAAFVQVSGFEAEALIGAPHKLVRHPDMPRQAFADLWATLRAGQAWTALVKNRRRDGDHYWVRANVAPLRRGGEVRGYISVRTQPTRDEVAAAERLYQRFRDGSAQGLAFCRGLVVRRGWQRWRNLLQTATMATRLRLALWPQAPLMVGMAWLAGLRQPAALAGLALVGTLALALADAWLQWQVTAPLKRIARQAADAAAGQFDADLRMARIDEIGMALRSINQAGLNVRALVADVGGQVGGLQQVADQVQQASGALGSRTEQASIRLAEAASALAQLTGSVAQNAQSALRARDAAEAMAGTATQVGQQVGAVDQAMAQIRQASTRIADIVHVIDEIAFQTNILALNAAAEAGRAGPQGLGFAAVAGEVRQLAQRSQQAAREIKQLAASSSDGVAQGSQRVAQSRQAMDELLGQTREVSGLVQAISQACREQARGITGLGQQVDDLEQLTQRNAEMARQSVAAAAQMRERSGWLARAIAVFRHG
ncbi:MAG: PAS domain-containing protein [Burkholderiaceae bacterium]|nr:PAS domain-containing protein [Burkholderiaceae bacterium]